MDVSIDNVWASPSTLHARVTVWGPGKRWRHRYDVSVPTAEIPPEALAPLWEDDGREPPEPDLQMALFDGPDPVHKR